jgi:hypothetical protein
VRAQPRRTTLNQTANASLYAGFVRSALGGTNEVNMSVPTLLVRLVEYAHVRVLARSHRNPHDLMGHFLLSCFRDPVLGDMTPPEKVAADVARRARAVPEDYAPGDSQQAETPPGTLAAILSDSQ